MNYGSLKLNIAIIIKTRPPEYPFFTVAAALKLSVPYISGLFFSSLYRLKID